MDRLSSCYFCGDAFDASLDEYPVVPDALRPTEESTQSVVLCRGCHRKLSGIVESLVAAAETGGSTAQDIESGDGDDRTQGPTADTATEIEATLGDDEVLAPLVDDSADADGNEDTDTDEDDVTDPEAADSADEFQPKGTDSEREDDATEDSEAESETVDDSGVGTEGKAEEQAEQDVHQTVTRLENSKVMRLLQNREFPVDREGFVNVAANAYEVSEDDCETIIDLAIKHDLIAKDGDNLVAGDRWE